MTCGATNDADVDDEEEVLAIMGALSFAWACSSIGMGGCGKFDEGAACLLVWSMPKVDVVPLSPPPGLHGSCGGGDVALILDWFEDWCCRPLIFCNFNSISWMRKDSSIKSCSTIRWRTSYWRLTCSKEDDLGCERGCWVLLLLLWVGCEDMHAGISQGDRQG